MPNLLNIETKKLELVPQSAEEEEEHKKEIMAMSCTELIEKVADEILFDIPFGGIKVKDQVKKVERSIINIDRELTDYEEIMDEVNIKENMQEINNISSLSSPFNNSSYLFPTKPINIIPSSFSKVGTWIPKTESYNIKRQARKALSFKN